MAVHAALAALLIEFEAEFGGDNHLVSIGRQRLTHDFLIKIGTIGFGGVEQRHTAIESGTNHFDSFLLALGGSVAITEPHTTIAE